MSSADGKRYDKSLETKDELTATKRAAQAVKELQAQAKAIANSAVQSKCDADTEGIEWIIPTLPDGSNDYANATSKTVTWGEIAASDDLIKRTDWQDLLKEALRVRKQNKGETYSPG